MRRLLLLFGLFFLMIISSQFLAAQYYDGGHPRPTVRWRVISGESFDLIFADTLERRAQQLAAYLDTLLPVMQAQYGRPLRRLPVVLHNEVTSPNAFVGWAPSRMEFFTMPPAGGEADDWLTQLAIHESTHWFQFSQMYQGTTGVLAAVFGEHMAAAVMGLFLPYWLIEGDAVYQETAMTLAGRGRDAEFERLLRTRMVTGRHFSYNRAVLGSYRDQTPGPYETGYQLAAYGREQYGDHLWDSVYRYVARKWWLITPFNFAIRKHTGISKRKFYRNAMGELSDQWRMVDTTVYWDTVSRVTATAGRWGEYHRPQLFMGGDLLAERRHPGALTAVVAVSHGGGERHLFYPGHTLDNPVTYGNGRVIYTAWARHPRWPNVQYSDLWVYDFGQDTLMQLTHRGRYGGAIEDPIVGEIYTMRYRPDHRHELVRMTGDGEVLAEIALPAGVAPADPGWWTARDMMLFVAVTPRGKAIYAWDGSEEPEQVTPFTHANIGNPTGWHKGVLFHAPHHGIDQVFLFMPEEELTYRITQCRFGARYPAIDANGDLLFSEIAEQGLVISALPSDEWLMERIAWPGTPAGFRFADRMEEPPLPALRLAEMCDTCYAVEIYRPARNLFRFHSRAPADINPDNGTVRPGVSVMSQNTLSTAFLRTGIGSNINTGEVDCYATFTYKGLWPWLHLDYTFTEAMYYTEVGSPVDNFRYGRHTAGVSAELPLTTSRKQWNSHFNAETGFRIMSLVHLKGTAEEFPRGNLSYGHARLYVHLLRRMARRDVYPRWGQAFSVAGLYATGGSFDAGNVMAARWISYWPGVVSNHGVRIYLAAQKRTGGEDLTFNRLINTPRGYHEVSVDNGAALQAAYKLPLLSPDITLGPLLYIKRIVVTGFYDHLILEKESLRHSRYSYGYEIDADMHVLRHFAPITVGFGIAYRNDGGTHRYFQMNIHL
jgi:hypothetical protein